MASRIQLVLHPSFYLEIHEEVEPDPYPVGIDASAGESEPRGAMWVKFDDRI